MAAVDEDGEADDARPAEVHEGVHGGADRAAREQHVVDEDHDAALHGEADLGAAHLRLLGLEAEVVAVERDVEGAHGRLRRLDRLDLLGDALGERLPARLDADEGDLVDALGLLDDLVGDAGQRAVERDLVEDLGLVAIGHRGQKKAPARGVDRVDRTIELGCVVMALLAGLTGPA